MNARGETPRRVSASVVIVGGGPVGLALAVSLGTAGISCALLASMNTFDFIVLLLLSNVLQNAVIGNDTSLTGGAVGAVTFVAVNAGVNRLITVSPAAARFFEGEPTTVVSDGHVITAARRHLGIRPSEPDHTVRMQNGDDITEVGSGSLEPSGQLVLTLKPGEHSATKDDVTELASQLRRIEDLLGTPR